MLSARSPAPDCAAAFIINHGSLRSRKPTDEAKARHDFRASPPITVVNMVPTPENSIGSQLFPSFFPSSTLTGQRFTDALRAAASFAHDPVRFFSSSRTLRARHGGGTFDLLDNLQRLLTGDFPFSSVANSRCGHGFSAPAVEIAAPALVVILLMATARSLSSPIGLSGVLEVHQAIDTLQPVDLSQAVVMHVQYRPQSLPTSCPAT
jgi:hypothetical protein